LSRAAKRAGGQKARPIDILRFSEYDCCRFPRRRGRLAGGPLVAPAGIERGIIFTDHDLQSKELAAACRRDFGEL